MSLSDNEYIYIGEELFFTCFVFLLNTGLARLSDDIRALRKVNNVESMKVQQDSIQHKYLTGDFSSVFHLNGKKDTGEMAKKEELIVFFYNLCALSKVNDSFEIQERIHDGDFQEGLLKINIQNDFSHQMYDIMFDKSKVLFNDLSKYLQLFYLIVYPGDTFKYLREIDFDFSNTKQVFYYHMLCFIDTSFYNNDYKKSYSHLLEAEKVFPEFSQIYALKVRTLYFVGFNYYSVHDQQKIRRELLNKNNPVFQRIQENISLSHNYHIDNRGVFIFELALYLHCGDWRGICFFLKNYQRRREFFHAQRVNIFLWLGKFFYRQGYYKQAKHYLYTEIGQGKFKRDVYKARLIYAIVSQEQELYTENIAYFISNLGYEIFFLSQRDDEYYDKYGQNYHVYQDVNIILPRRKELGEDLLLKNIDVELLRQGEKGNWPHVYLLTPSKQSGK